MVRTDQDNAIIRLPVEEKSMKELAFIRVK